MSLIVNWRRIPPWISPDSARIPEFRLIPVDSLDSPRIPGGISSDCQGFWNPHGLRVGYRRVRVRVQIPVPATYKTSPRTSKTDRNWWRYGPNSRKYCLAHISVISGPFWLFLGSKTHRVAGKGPWGKGTGWEKKPQGYPWQSLGISGGMKSIAFLPA